MISKRCRVGDFDYERGGSGYETQRRADPRIADQIHRALGDAASVLNIGAGAGSYEPSDRYVLAVEPSAAMRARRRLGRVVPAIDASAQALPFDGDTVDAAMAIFTVHQWGEGLGPGLRELRRVTRGPIVIMTIDGDALAGFWLGEYLPVRMDIERRRFPSIDNITALLGGTSMIEPVPIPVDCTDGFVEAFYGHPESLLDPVVRHAQSTWQFLDHATTQEGLDTLAEDLRTGAWDARYGHLRHQSAYAGPLVLLIAQP
jgi:SAM-dependent methyltransferase